MDHTGKSNTIVEQEDSFVRMSAIVMYIKSNTAKFKVAHLTTQMSDVIASVTKQQNVEIFKLE